MEGNEETKDGKNTVEIDRAELAQFVQVAKVCRNHALMCTPQFAAGSGGDNAVRAIVQFGDAIERFEKVAEG